MYNKLFFHDGETGQFIVPILHPGNKHSNKYYVSIPKRVVMKIQKVYPNIKIIIREDSGFSCPAFYQLAEDLNLFFTLGLSSNEILKQRTTRTAKAASHLFVFQRVKHQYFMVYSYQAGNWHKPQQCYSKIESTGKGLNIRYIVSNMEEGDA